MGAHYEFAQTDKQTEIMKLILAQADLGSYITLTALREQLSYKPSKQAILCSVRVLEGHGFLTKIHHGCRTMEIIPTALAYSTFRATPTRF
jgi:repressor of nif and glnA expression